MKKNVIAGILLATTLLTACSAPEAGLPKREMPQTTPAVNESRADELIPAKPDGYVLSDDFVSRYIDEDAFNRMIARTERGMKIAEDTADMTAQEIALWREIVMSAYFNQYTTDDLEAKIYELYKCLADVAAKHNMTEEEFLATDPIAMKADEVKAFFERQAAKFAEKQAQSENGFDVSEGFGVGTPGNAVKE